MSIANKKKEVFFNREQISSKVAELGNKITKDYQGKKLLVISLLKGSFIFTADLVREINMDLAIDFMTTSSYADTGTENQGTKLVKDITIDVSDYDVLLVDDIADSGLTLKYVMEHLAKKNPLSLKSCVFLDKPSRRKVEIEPDYVGYTVPDKFIIGYGLNYGNSYRNLADIYGVEF